MSSYLELFAKAIGMPKPIERSRYELETEEERMARIRRREMGSTPTTSSEKEEVEEAEPKEKIDTAEGIRLGNALLRGDKYILSCTCGSWGHLCEAVEHECPTKCLRIVRG